MRKTLQNTEHLTIRQAEVSEIITENDVIGRVKTFSGAVYHSRAVVLCTGVYLKARCLYGDDRELYRAERTDGGKSSDRFPEGTRDRDVPV